MAVSVNEAVFNRSLDFKYVTKKTVTFSGSTSTGIGYDTGTQDPYTLFNVTGVVRCSLIAVTKTTITGSASTAAFYVTAQSDTIGTILTQITPALGFSSAGALWIPGGTATTGYRLFEITPGTTSALKSYFVSGDLKIYFVGTNTTGGVVDFYCFWSPLGDGASGSVVATG